MCVTEFHLSLNYIFRYLYRCLNDTALTRAQAARSFMQVVQSDHGRTIAVQFFKDNWSAIYKR